MSELSAITLESVSRFEKGVTSPLLKSITADLKKGQLIAVVGADGAGKTTLMRVMAGLLKPQEGAVKLFGEKLYSKELSRLQTLCGYMPQQDLLFPWRTVAENVRLPLEIKGGMDQNEMDKAVNDALKNVGLDGWGDKSPSELSGGMRQRAAFARTILTGCDLLLLDEPFSALDYLTRLSLREWLLKQWEREHKTILFITHDVEEAVFLSNRVLAVTGFPISELKSVEIPAGYPRDISSLSEPGMARIKEELIDMLRREAPADEK